jgi:hypothetical protein
MRKLLPVGFVCLIAACAPAPAELALKLRIDVTDQAVQTELIKDGIEVLGRRLARYGAEMSDLRTERTADGAVIRVTVPDRELADEVAAEIMMPFTFRIVREEAGATGTGAYEFKGQGTFVETGVTEADLQGAEWAADGQGGAIRLVFTPAGKEKLKSLAASAGGKALGIVSRGVLMSKTRGDALGEELVIRGIPTVEFAEIFADDVNVGLHVHFTPVTQP